MLSLGAEGNAEVNARLNTGQGVDRPIDTALGFSICNSFYTYPREEYLGQDDNRITVPLTYTC